MNLLTLVDTLETVTDLHREIVSSKRVNQILSYTSTSKFTTEINEDTYTKTNRLCLVHKDNEIYLYINNLTATNLNKINIDDISTITITME